LWNHYETGNTRTTNAVEGWHRIINSYLRKPRPNIFKFMDIIKQQQHKSAIRIAQLQNGAPGQRRKRTYANLDAAIDRLKTQLQNGEIQLANYLDAVGYNIRF
jgi:carbamate kinase